MAARVNCMARPDEALGPHASGAQTSSARGPTSSIRTPIHYGAATATTDTNCLHGPTYSMINDKSFACLCYLKFVFSSTIASYGNCSMAFFLSSNYFFSLR